MPLLPRGRRSSGGGDDGEEAGRSGQLEPAGPPTVSSQEDVRSGSAGSLRTHSRQGGSLLDMAG